MSAQIFPAMAPMSSEMDQGTPNPLKAVLVTVFTLKIAIAAILVATVSLAPPLSPDGQYVVSSIQN